MSEESFDIEAAGEHHYLIRVQDTDEEIRIRLRVGEAAMRDLGAETEREGRVATATMRFLLARQHAFDLPADLDLEDVAAAYADFTDTIRREVAGPAGSASSGA